MLYSGLYIKNHPCPVFTHVLPQPILSLLITPSTKYVGLPPGRSVVCVMCEHAHDLCFLVTWLAIDEAIDDSNTRQVFIREHASALYLGLTRPLPLA